jgi:inner membrane protein
LDNITHAVVGVLMAEAALVFREHRARSTAAPVDGIRASAMLVSVLANNAPDIDSAYASLLTRPLGSLMHHRGHTHTLALVPLLAALAVAVTLAVARARGMRFETRDKIWLFALALSGVLVHIALDSTNSYGVHPFWPLYDGWFYGDSIFIIEPLIWAALIPPLVFCARTRSAQIALAAVVVLGVGLCWLREFVPRSMAILATLVAVGSTIASRKATPTVRVALSAGLTTVVALTFAISGAAARSEMTRASATTFPRARTHDAIFTPMPANPFCWQAVLVQTEGERYVTRTGVVATFPRFLSSDECYFDRVTETTAPVRPMRAPKSPSLRWIREFSAPLGELHALARDSCVFGALLRFARAPFWTNDEALGRVAGDIRYDVSSGLDFSDTVLDGVDCPENLPPWIPPRSALVEARD